MERGAIITMTLLRYYDEQNYICLVIMFGKGHAGLYKAPKMDGWRWKANRREKWDQVNMPIHWPVREIYAHKNELDNKKGVNRREKWDQVHMPIHWPVHEIYTHKNELDNKKGVKGNKYDLYEHKIIKCNKLEINQVDQGIN